jgi:predicted nuclease with TOPRIM domain
LVILISSQEAAVREQLEQRLAVLKSEYETGQQMLSELEARQARLRETLLRISGAIQVLEEELGHQTAQPGGGTLETNHTPQG